MARLFPFILGIVIPSMIALPLAQAAEPPTSWVDKDTGHRVIRLTPEAGSSGFYFNVNAYSPDGKLMAYAAPDGIHVLDLATLKTRLLVPNPPRDAAAPVNRGYFRNGVHAVVVGRKTNSVFFTRYDSGSQSNCLYKADMYTGTVKKLVTLPPSASIASINADETLGVGTLDENPADAAREYGQNRPAPSASSSASSGRSAPAGRQSCSARGQRGNDGTPPCSAHPGRSLHRQS